MAAWCRLVGIGCSNRATPDTPRHAHACTHEQTRARKRAGTHQLPCATTQAGFLGLRSPWAGGRLLQARRKAPCMGFSSTTLFGTWEQWQVVCSGVVVGALTSNSPCCRRTCSCGTSSVVASTVLCRADLLHPHPIPFATGPKGAAPAPGGWPVRAQADQQEVGVGGASMLGGSPATPATDSTSTSTSSQQCWRC